jgi:hypothetical protein
MGIRKGARIRVERYMADNDVRAYIIVRQRVGLWHLAYCCTRRWKRQNLDLTIQSDRCRGTRRIVVRPYL